ncbi:hypothetical protein [Vacuolonema iberomarrocanum]|uniref:hypothetical protein n=1 Tax=Vacuolonema iberomarrocanum TaxID=3454632 RepID=UPI0019E5A9F0|nr:hypothetical protein [filamentous cyanobacterium LEGE 07170]
MDISRIRHILGFAWFYLLAFITATVIISMDADVGSMANALSLPNLPAVVLFSLLVALLAAPSLLFFYRQRWILGVFLAVSAAIAAWGILLVLQTPDAQLTTREIVTLLPRAILIMGGWTLLVSLPAALLMRRS